MCGIKYTAKVGGQGGSCYCSDACRKIKARQVEVSRLVSKESKERRRDASVARRTNVCKACRCEFFRGGYAERKYCSRRCAVMKAGKNKKQPRHVYMCRFCGSVVIRTQYEAHGRECFCDGVCYLAFRKHAIRLTPIVATDIATDKKCVYCNGPIVGRLGNRRIFCSKSCSAKKHKQDRKMKKVCNGPMDVISLDVLAKKSNYTCCLCGVNCKKSTGENLWNDATIDHVIPVSKGGVHTWSNVQLLCRSCNNRKSDNLPVGTQLNLALV